MSDKPGHRVYHGQAVTPMTGDKGDARLLVMDSGPGPTERKRARVLYELAPKTPFWWGYGGGSPSRTSDAILEDALAGMSDAPELTQSLRTEMSVAFTGDFLAYFHDDHEFWLPARTVVRWIRGYLQEQANR